MSDLLCAVCGLRPMQHGGPLSPAGHDFVLPDAVEPPAEKSSDVVLGPWGKSSPCVQCGMWHLVEDRALGVLVRKAPHLDEHGRCPDCRVDNEAAAIRVAMREAEGQAIAAQQRQRSAGEAWWHLAYTAVGYCSLRDAPLELAVPVANAVPTLRQWGEWQRKRRRNEPGWQQLPVPEVPADLVWAVVDAAVDAVRHGKVDASPIGRDLRALVEGMPHELRREVRS